MKTIITCSAGRTLPEGAESTENADSFGCSACEYVNDNRVHRCNEFIELAGVDAQGKDWNRWTCAKTAMPSLLIESASTNRSVAMAIESQRNEQIKRQDKMLELAEQGKLIPLEKNSA